MPRSRALLSALLAVTWFTAVWHVNLEAVGMLLKHEPHAPDNHSTHHIPGTVDDHHEPVFARDATKEGEILIEALILPCWPTAGIFQAGRDANLSQVPLGESVPIERRADRLIVQVWQFMWRCAPESAAPPVLT